MATQPAHCFSNSGQVLQSSPQMLIVEVMMNDFGFFSRYRNQFTFTMIRASFFTIRTRIRIGGHGFNGFTRIRLQRAGNSDLFITTWGKSRNSLQQNNFAGAPAKFNLL